MPTDVNKVLKTKSLAAFTLIYILIFYVIVVNKKIYKWPHLHIKTWPHLHIKIWCN